MPLEFLFTGDKNPLCPDTMNWSAKSTKSSEDEVNEFLYALVRMIKPNIVVETGCYLGDATIPMADALNENGFGELFTCDTDPECVLSVISAVKNAHEHIVIVTKEEGVSLIRRMSKPIDFAFIDSSGDGKIREQEIEALIPRLARFGMFAIHDTAPHHESIHEAAKRIKMNYNLRALYFNTPRGLTLFQKQDNQIF